MERLAFVGLILHHEFPIPFSRNEGYGWRQYIIAGWHVSGDDLSLEERKLYTIKTTITALLQHLQLDELDAKVCLSNMSFLMGCNLSAEIKI